MILGGNSPLGRTRLRDLLFRLIPWGVIAGRVLDEEGEPLPWAQVSALREVYSGESAGCQRKPSCRQMISGSFASLASNPAGTLSAQVQSGLHIVGRAKCGKTTAMTPAGFMPIYYPNSPIQRGLQRCAQSG